MLDILSSSGVKDRHKHVVKELDSWDIWSLQDQSRDDDIRKMSQEWLEK